MYKRLIPSILIHEGRLVKGVQYKNYKDAGGSATTARAHNAQGADELIVCDIDASRKQTEPDYETLKRVAEECFMPLTIFGGINNVETAIKCMEIGADKIGITAAAYDDPSIIEKLAHKYGSQAVVLGLDIIKDETGNYKLYDYRNESIRDNDPFEWLESIVDKGIGEIRIMAVHNEGTLKGFDFELYERVKSRVNVPIILEGGCESLDHILEAYSKGVDAVAVGSMLVFSDANLVKIQQHMRSNGINIRN